MKCFVTGSNGFIGKRLVEKLSEQGNEINCLVRSPEKFAALKHKNTNPVYGDLDNSDALLSGTENCEVVFHLAGYAKVWSKDPELPYKINVQGTENLLKACLKNKVKKIIFTSTAAVFGPSPENQRIDEEMIRTVPFFNDYESSKAKAEEIAVAYARKGLNIVILCPTRVYGPGPINESNSITKIIKLYQQGKWHIIPGSGSKIGNYAYIEDVIKGHLLAVENGKSGEKYILGGENLSFDQFFEALGRVTTKKHFLVNIPIWLMIMVAKMMESQSKVTGIPPLITAPWVKKYLEHWNQSSEKAINQIGYKITPFEVGVQQTLHWLNSNN